MKLAINSVQSYTIWVDGGEPTGGDGGGGGGGTNSSTSGEVGGWDTRFFFTYSSNRSTTVCMLKISTYIKFYMGR